MHPSKVQVVMRAMPILPTETLKMRQQLFLCNLQPTTAPASAVQRFNKKIHTFLTAACISRQSTATDHALSNIKREKAKRIASETRSQFNLNIEVPCASPDIFVCDIDTSRFWLQACTVQQTNTRNHAMDQRRCSEAGSIKSSLCFEWPFNSRSSFSACDSIA